MESTEVNLDLARQALRAEGESIAALADQIGEDFAVAAKAVFNCPGKVILTGMGKAGVIAQKISATLASTGTQSIFLHPGEAVHGDLGRVQRGDVVVALSHSGTTDEILRLLDHIKGRGASLIVITSAADSPLGKLADIAVCYGEVREACPLGLAPTVSTAIMLALGDALALTVMQMRRFTPEEFAAFHPGGSLGRRLMTVEQAMQSRHGAGLCLADDSMALVEALSHAEAIASRRSGALLLVDKAGRLSGILTDADLRRLLVRRQDAGVLSEPVSSFMKRDPRCVRLGDLASEAMAIMNKYRFDELPVVDDDGKPVGILDVQDLVGIKTVANGRD